MRRLGTRFARRLSSCTCILLLLATQLPAAQAQDDLVARARQEGSVTLYGAMVADQANAVAERFKARYGISMNVLRIGADQIPTRVITEQRGGLNNVDLIAMPALQTGLLKRL